MFPSYTRLNEANENSTTGDNDGPRATHHLLYRGHRRPGCADGEEASPANGRRVLTAEAAQDDMSCLRE